MSSLIFLLFVSEIFYDCLFTDNNTNNPVTLGIMFPWGLGEFVERIIASCGNNQPLIAGIFVA